jgi:hypothetical protein
LLMNSCSSAAATAIHQFDRLLRQAIVLSLRPAIFDCNVATLDIAGLSEALLDCCDIRRVRGRRYAGQDSDHRHRRLLRARRERPRRCRPTDERDEIASFQLVELHSVAASQGRLQDIELARISQRVSERRYNLIAVSCGIVCGRKSRSLR